MGFIVVFIVISIVVAVIVIVIVVVVVVIRCTSIEKKILVTPNEQASGREYVST